MKSRYKLTDNSHLIIFTGLTWNSLICTPFGVISVLCAGCYTLSWQWDPCCKYQEEKHRRHLSTLPMLNDLTSATPVVLVRSDNRRKIVIHSTISIAAATICLWRIFKTFKWSLFCITICKFNLILNGMVAQP